ncbi:MAG: phage head-tail connector protein [Planctomycetia bacterium]|nr:phage head-tail connector protein [Planctomycetia bacterium]
MLPRKVIAGPAQEPLTLEEAKRFLRITSDAEDDVVLALVAAARKRIERGTELALITQTVEVKLDGFWGSCAIELPMPPLQEVVSIQYLDAAGALQTLPADTYKVSTHRRPGRVWLASGKSWPTTKDEREAVTVTFNAGFGDDPTDVPPNLIHAMRMLCAHYDRHREAVMAGEAPQLVPEGVEALMAGERIPEAA